MSSYFTFIILIILLPIMALAGIVYVPGDQPSIQAGINAAVNGDTVLVADSTYFENINFMGKAITVASYMILDGDTTHRDSTIINGSQPGNPDSGSVVFFISGEDTASVLDGFTITGGTGTLSDGTSRVGGGIFCYASGSRILHNKIINNTITNTGESRGGGIGTFPWGNNSFTIIEDNVILSNTCISNFHAQGGGVYIPQGKILNNIIRGNLCDGNSVSVSALGGGIHGASAENDQRFLQISNNLLENNLCTNSSTYSRGGGVFAWGGIIISLDHNTINHNRVSSLAGASGGGVDLNYSQAPSIIRDNSISFNFGNTQGSGGGLRLFETQGVQIIGNRFVENDSIGWGGGISTWNSPGTQIIGNKFIGNAADTSGGGIDIEESNNSIIDKNLFKQNTAKYGGGIFKFNGNSTITNNIILENNAQQGGGIQEVNYPPQTYETHFINNTLAGNVANNAGGIYLWGVKIKMMNTICWENFATFAPEILLDDGTMDIAHSDIRFGADSIQVSPGATLNWMDGNIIKEPMLRGDSLMLSDSSSCIGAGTIFYQFSTATLYCPSPCFLGHTRPAPLGTNPDMGACESLLDSPVVGLENQYSNNVPTSFELKQNYPNPFNPITNIEFRIPCLAGRQANSEFITLKVYNLLGQEVVTLLSASLIAGSYQYEWDASNHASGVYLYKLEAGQFVEVRKMILLK